MSLIFNEPIHNAEVKNSVPLFSLYFICQSALKWLARSMRMLRRRK